MAVAGTSFGQGQGRSGQGLQAQSRRTQAQTSDAAIRPAALDAIVDQPRVREFLSAAVAEGRLSHAYLFVGAPGSGKHEAAEALAKCIVCPSGGDGTCDECRRVAHRTHPDVTWLSPGSATGYLIDQIRNVIQDAALSPVRAESRVYVLERAELLRANTANALLKTLEEPPSDVVFILCARSTESVLPTIVSRCQVVPFSVVGQDVGVAAVMRSCVASEEEARLALAVAGSPTRAVEYLRSPSRQETRKVVVSAIDDLALADSWDVILSARKIVETAKVSLADLKEAQEKALEDSADFLSAAALKDVEDANKREISARERSAMIEALSAAESLLRDVLAVCEDVSQPIVNADVAVTVERIAADCSVTGAIKAIEAVSRAADDLTWNVSPQLTIEVMLFRIKEALVCPPSYR